MNNPDMPDGPEESDAEDGTPVEGIENIRKDIHFHTESVRETDMQKFQRLRESGALSPHNCDPNFLSQLKEYGFPLRRADLVNQPVVLTRDEFVAIGYIDLVLPNGEEIRVGAESLNDDVFILFPDDLGD